MSADVQNGQLPEGPSGVQSVPEDAILDAVSLPESWTVEDDPMADDLLLVKNRNQERWQSITVSIARRKAGNKVQTRYRKAPYQRGRVGSDPVERETHETWSAAINWVQQRLQRS